MARATADDGQEHDGRVDAHDLAVDPRRRDVALELLYHDERDGSKDRGRRGLEERQDQRGDGAQEGAFLSCVNVRGFPRGLRS